jgi:hypothetical protein
VAYLTNDFFLPCVEVTQALEYFKEVEKHTFTNDTLLGGAQELFQVEKTSPQWQMDSGNNCANDSTLINHEDCGPSNDGALRPRENKASYQDLRREALSIAL